MTDSILTDSIPPRAGDPQFPLGQIVATPSALAALSLAGVPPETLVDRHAHGDWGDLCEEDRAMNDGAVSAGGRLLSAYALPDGARVWIITEADRTATTLLLPDEY